MAPPARAIFTGALVACVALVARDAGAQAVLRFADRSAASGLDLVTWSGSREKPHLLESTGNGILTLDYDGDGYQDLYVVAAYRLPRDPAAVGERSALYRNLGDGTFADVSARAGADARVYGHGGCVADVDGDGLLDLYVTAYGANLLYRNRGDGTFAEIGTEAGVADAGWSIGCAFLDADGDGDADLFVANYVEASWPEVLQARRTRRWRERVSVMDGPRGLPEASNRYYVNDGAGAFRDATESSGLAAGGRGYTMAAQALDADGDGDPDLYLANDSTPNRLYRNAGDGTFEEIGALSGVAYSGEGRLQGSMGIGAGDVDGDGLIDLVVTNFAHDHYTLYRNLGGGLFRDDSYATGIAVTTFRPLGWAALLFDADNDRDLDLFLANGHIYPQVDEDPSLGESYRQANQLLRNDGGRFAEVGAEAGDGLAIVESSRGAVSVDLDNDGDLDLVVSNQDARPSLLVNETARAGRWLEVDLRGGGRLGARVEIEARGERRVAELASSAGYASASDPRLHFGLGASARAEAVRIAWAGGGRIVLRDVPADRVIVTGRARRDGAGGGG